MTLGEVQDLGLLIRPPPEGPAPYVPTYHDVFGKKYLQESGITWYVGMAVPINLQQQAGHVPGTPQYANRIDGGKLTSSFFNAKQAESVTLEAWEKGTPLGADGTMRLFDFGKPIGVGPGGGGFQTQVRVSIDSGGKIHGTPWGPVFQGPLPQ